MQFKFLTSIVLIALIVGVALAWRSTMIGFQSRQPDTIKVVINQPPTKDGALPVEIIQPSFVSSAPNKLDDLTYVLRNNSGRAVIAAAVVKTITYEEGGKTYGHSVYSTMDTAFDPDMRGKPFLTGTQMSMESAGPLAFSEGAIIKQITLTLEYVSFDDNSASGSGREGEHRIKAMREGARLYKNWLKQEYSRAGQSLTTIFTLIQAPGIPEGLKLDSDQTMGADRYRLQLLSTFRKKGAADVERYLRQNQ